MVTLDQCGWLGDRATVAPRTEASDDLVEHLFVLDMRGAEQDSWMIMPDASAHVIVHCTRRSDGFPVIRASLVGPRTKGVPVDVAGRRWTVGARLRPGALPPLTGFSARELTDGSVSLGDVWGPSADRAVREAVRGGPGAVLRAVEGVLARAGGPSVRRAWRGRALARWCRETHGGMTVAGAAQRLGVSVRSLRAASTELIGLSPKTLARIQRLHRAVEASIRRPEWSWTRVAAGTGYSDQSHLTREFKDLLGETPVQFRARGRGARAAPDPVGPADPPFDADSYNRGRWRPPKMSAPRNPTGEDT